MRGWRYYAARDSGGLRLTTPITPVTARRMIKPVLRIAMLLLACTTTLLSAQQPAPTGATGRISGRVVDKETGRPLSGGRIAVVGQAGVLETDLDGRYRTPPLPVGLYSVRAALIGFTPVLRDSIRVIAGQSVTVDFVMTVKAVELDELTAVVDAPVTTRSDAGLLAAQQAAPSASDGISAEAISRSPDSDGGDVIRRVTGITVFDKKFVVVRGLGERYSNTQLNGADLPSPEPLKRVVPLDIFPASLLESIVTTKAATPDKPGDFTGGSVEIKTKEFPEQFSMQFGVSQGVNSQTTFERSAIGPRTTGDLFAFGDSHRRPSREALSGSPELSERAMESFRDVWTGRQDLAQPNTGINFNLGGQVGESAPIGFVLAVTYSNRRQFTPDKLLAFRPDLEEPIGNGRVLDESVAEVEWGAIGNLSWRPFSGTKLGFKNFYSRGSEETMVRGVGYNTENSSTYNTYGIGYVERELFQTQLSGEHLLGFLWDSRFEWKGTVAWANRSEPDNRRANYLTTAGTPILSQISVFQVRDLKDRTATGQADLTIPFALRRSADASFKVGALLRDKPRTFRSGYFQAFTAITDAAVLTQPPEATFAPENVGSTITIQRYDAIGADYDSDDDLTAAYGMVDVPLLPRVRLVGGLRAEHWRITVFPGGRNDPFGQVYYRRPWDYLWSANLTFSLTDRMNLRMAGFRSLSRPDPRELVADRYQPVAQECEIVGDTSLVTSRITNADLRWEYYGQPGEVFAVSGFYKKFKKPLVEVTGAGAGSCVTFTTNGLEARNYGMEFEARKNLDFLPGFLAGLSVGFNATVLKSSIDLDSVRFGNARGLTLQGQSPFVANGSIAWDHAPSGTSLQVLYNYFDTRIARYGSGDPTNQTTDPPVNVLEEGRYSLDVKAQQQWGALRFSLSGTNVTNRPVRWSLDGSHGKVVTRRFFNGSTWTLGVNADVF